MLRVKTSIVRMALNAKFYYIGMFFLLSLFFACGNNTTASEPKQDENSPNDWVLIFLDKTLSLTNDSLQLQFEKPIRGRLFDLINLEGDKVLLHFVHGNTSGAQAVLNKVVDAKHPSEDELAGLGERSKKQRMAEYEGAISDQQTKIADKVKEAFSRFNPESTNRHTDLWASFEVMSRVFSEAKPIDRKHVFYVSDMEESVKGEKRHDFTRKAPKDKIEAQTWAKEDVDVINQYYKIKPEALDGTEITIYVPHTTLENTRFQTVRYYWEALFEALRIEKVTVH